MSEIFRLAGFFVLAVMAYGIVDGIGVVDKTRFLIMAIVGLLMITIGYLGDILDTLKELKEEKREAEKARMLTHRARWPKEKL